MTPSPMNRPRRKLAPVLALGAALVSTSCGGSDKPWLAGKVKHVFVIVLENEGYETSFGSASPATYLSQTLRAQGQLLTQYYGIGHLSLPNYIAMISGQAPSGATQGDCRTYSDFVSTAPTDANGQAVGDGCVYPADVETLADQLEDAGLTWRGYMEDMGNDPNSPSTCRHPTLGMMDPTQSARLGDQYAARHNPFVYFHSIIDSPSCAANDVPLTQLDADLASVTTTANFTFITPNLCNDGHDGTCVDGSTGGLVAADAFLAAWVPKILASAAYQDDGLLIVTFDEAEGFAGTASEACCDEVPRPNRDNPGILGPGGGRVGAVLVSPHIEPGSTNDTPYNHYSLLRSLEDNFELPHLGFAAAAGLKPFGPDVFTR